MVLREGFFFQDIADLLFLVGVDLPEDLNFGQDIEVGLSLFGGSLLDDIDKGLSI